MNEYGVDLQKARQAVEFIVGRGKAPFEGEPGLTPRAQVSEHTVDLMLKHGFIWHSDCFDDDLPYTVEADGKSLVEVPRSTLTDDYAMLGSDSSLGTECWKIQSIPKKTRSSQYSRSITWVRKDNYAAARLDNFVGDDVVRRLGTVSIVLTLSVTSSPVTPSPRVAARTSRPDS